MKIVLRAGAVLLSLWMLVSCEIGFPLTRAAAEAYRLDRLSEECGVEDIDWLTPRLVAEGHAYDELIRNADGTENKAASRRVEIGFTINLEG